MSGTAICRRPDRGRSTAIASTAPTFRKRVTASIPHKLLIDPYAKALVGEIKWSDAHFGYRIGHQQADLSFDLRDDAHAMPKCRVIDPTYNWGDDAPPRIPWQDTVIYEMHVKGFTMTHPGVPPELRGTYAGLASAAGMEHLKRLGVTAVELMPVQPSRRPPSGGARTAQLLGL